MYLYFIRQKSNKPISETPIKIGITKNINRRLKELQTASPFKLEVIKSFDVSGDKKAKAIESTCHKILKRAGKHLSGEWFKEVKDITELYEKALSMVTGAYVKKLTKAQKKQLAYEKEIRANYEQKEQDALEAQSQVDREQFFLLYYHGYFSYA
jgi:predicted GIY-YIG superfamily endonuclease